MKSVFLVAFFIYIAMKHETKLARMNHDDQPYGLV